MSQNKNSDSSSTSDAEVIPSSSKFDPVKALYSGKPVIPVRDAPMYETIKQFEDAQEHSRIVAVGQSEVVRKREQAKEAKRLEEERLLQEKNLRRFAQYRDLAPVRQPKTVKNVLTRIDNAIGPLAALKDCVDNRLRVKIITRHGSGIRGELHATLVAFDKQWNFALTDVTEIWRRKSVKKRKIPACMGIPVPNGTAQSISAVPAVKETPLGGGLWECTRHIPQLMIRGEHVVLVNIVER